MPQARRSSSTSRSSSSFKEPPALKRFKTSIDSAQKALGDLSRGSSRDVAKDIYADLRKVVSSARRDSERLGKALQRDFEKAQKDLAKAASGTSSRRTSTSRSTSRRSTASRSTGSRSTKSRASSTRSTAGRSATKRGGSTRSSSKSGGTTRSGSSRRGSSKS